MEQTIVHVARHGQVHNPDGVLYGRQPGYHLSELGRQMADRLGEHFADVPLTLLRCSPLERARETMEPIAARHPELSVGIEDRVIEAANVFEGATRMRAAIAYAARDAGEGGQAVIVAHELPIWMARLSAEGRPLVHDPRHREARLASVTSFTFLDGRVVRVDYVEPAGDLVPVKKGRKFRPGS